MRVEQISLAENGLRLGDHLSEHFTYGEMIRSQYAARHRIINVPNQNQVTCLEMLCLNVLEPIREEYGGPIFVTSGYRCYELNKAIGGAPYSQHMEGKAADIVCGIPPRQLCEMILRMQERGDIEYDQLILEYDEWVHVSYNSIDNRRSNFEMTKDQNG